MSMNEVIWVFLVLALGMVVAWASHVTAKKRTIENLKISVESLKSERERLDREKTCEIKWRDERLEESRTTLVVCGKFLKTFVPCEQVHAVLQALAIRFHEVSEEEIQVQQGKKQMSPSEQFALRMDLEGRKGAFHSTLNLVNDINMVMGYGDFSKYPSHDDHVLYLPREMQAAARRR